MSHSVRRTRIATLLVSVFALGLYTLTLAPGVGPIDSGELTLAASHLGVPHPPGFPLYVVVTHVISRLPIGSIATRVNFASALFAAIAAAGIFQLTLILLRPDRDPGRKQSTPGKPGRVRTSSSALPDVPDSSAEWIAIAGAMTAALLFVSLRTPWAYATVAEVYALSACIAVLIWLLMLQRTVGRMRVAAVLFGLGLGAHPAIVVPMLPALAVLVVRWHGVRFFGSRQFVVLFMLAGAGAGIYLYLPLAASQSPFLNWGDPRTLERLWAHLSGGQYRGEASDITLVGFTQAWQRLGGILAQQLSGQLPVALLLVMAGAVHAFRNDRAVFAALATWMVVNVLLTTSMNARWAGERGVEGGSDDLDAYYLPTLIVACVIAGVGAAALLKTRRLVGSSTRLASAGVLAVALLQPLFANWRTTDRRTDVASRNYVDDVLRSVETGGLLLMRDWNLSSPMMHVQHVERDRADVAALDLNLMQRRWYLESVSRKYPELFSSAQNELAAFLDVATRWHDDPHSIQRDDAYHAVLVDAFDGLLMKIVEAHLLEAPVYVTFEVATTEDGKGLTFAAKLASRFQLVPQGLVFQLDPDMAFHEPMPLALRGSPVLNLPQPAGPSQVVSQRIAAIYRDMLISRGLYLESHGQCPQAVAAFRDALQIDSTSPTAEAVRARCKGAPAAHNSPATAPP